MFENRSFTFYSKRREKKPAQKVATSDKLFFNLLFLAVIALVIYLIYPLINPIIIGVLTAMLFYGFNRRVVKLCKGKYIIGAAISTVSIFILVVVPLIAFLYMAVDQGIGITNDTTDYLKSKEFQDLVIKVENYQFFVWAKETFNIKEDLISTKGDEKGTTDATVELAEEVAELTEEVSEASGTTSEASGTISEDSGTISEDSGTISEDSGTISEDSGTVSKGSGKSDESHLTLFEKVMDPLKSFLANASQKVFGLISLAGNMIFSLLISLLVMFYVFCDGKRLLRIVHHLSPLPKSQEDALFARIRSVSRSAMQGTFFTACCQGIVAMVGLAIAGLPALFLGTLFGITSMVPVVGTAIVLIPLLGYLLIIGNVGTAIFIFVWCMIFNNIVDYVIRPRLMKGEDNMPTVIMLFAIIGGVGRFGLLGFVYGPVIFGTMAVLMWIYEERNSLFLNGQDRK